MRNNILIITFILETLLLFGQDKSNFNLLETDTTWNQEIFHFPISFAPEIKYEGFEDARFPKFWAYKDSIDFWSYVFVWCINEPKELTSNNLENDIEMYFNGLMNYQYSTALFFKKDFSKYIGKLKTFDALITKKSISLNVTVDFSYCEYNKKTFITFKFSPQEFGEKIWDKLEKVKLRNDYCEN